MVDRKVSLREIAPIKATVSGAIKHVSLLLSNHTLSLRSWTEVIAWVLWLNGNEAHYPAGCQPSGLGLNLQDPCGGPIHSQRGWMQLGSRASTSSFSSCDTRWFQFLKGRSVWPGGWISLLVWLMVSRPSFVEKQTNTFPWHHGIFLLRGLGLQDFCWSLWLRWQIPGVGHVPTWRQSWGIFFPPTFTWNSS